VGEPAVDVNQCFLPIVDLEREFLAGAETA
jgi:hypothetical protein